MTDWIATKTYWIVMEIFKWEDIAYDANVPLPPIKFNAPKGQAGYIPVFHNREDAIELAGDESRVMEISVGGKAEVLAKGNKNREAKP